MVRILPATMVALAAATAGAQAPYPAQPDWTSTDTRVSTGAALADIDRDGWLDLVVSNGNDMAVQPVAVYLNSGAGGFPATPDWLSADSGLHGHLDVADVDGDGWPDVAVTTLGDWTTFGPVAKLYLNNAGTLSATPDWQAGLVGNAFGCAFGDVNNDGRPDLAVATGWAYSPSHHYANVVYVNAGGALPTAATWSSDDDHHLQGVLWVDVDGDGWLDLAGATVGAETPVYRNPGGALETTASWRTTDGAGQDAIMLATGDVTGDGRPELFVTDNTQLGGSGRTRQYDGVAGGLATTYSWSALVGYGSAVALGDVNADGALDLVTGGWWEQARLHLNQGGGLATAAAWTSGPSTVVERLVLGDVDRDGVMLVAESIPAAGRRLLQLSRQPVETVRRVWVDGVERMPDGFTFHRESGWVTVGIDPIAEVAVEYEVSLDLDLAVTNWDSDVGNQLYLNRTDRLVFGDGFEAGVAPWSSTGP